MEKHEQSILENANKVARDESLPWPDRYEGYITLKARAYNKRASGDPCWCSSSDKPERDHAPICNAALRAVHAIEAEIRASKSARPSEGG